MRPLLLLLMVAFAGIPASAEGGTYQQASLRADPSSHRAERQILKLLNRERRSRGLAPLVFDKSLARAARLHSRQMAGKHHLTHRLAGEPKYPHRLNRVGVRFNASGENVALAADAAQAHRALMRSRGHRANILSRHFNSVGIGVVRSARGIYVTQDFARLLPNVSVDEAERSVARSLNRMRRKAGASRLRRVSAPELRVRACEMADAGRVDPRAAMLPRADNAIAFTVSDLDKLARPLGGLQKRRARAFSVGACYRASRRFDSPVFWILLATYR